ncbi:hypothetical protein BMI91_13175 [Thioclava sediminum]|uniref:DNA primase/polymerase bifunctional N-terminal domain-containing protein n=1 Tax=Thioclava sediminum TaxID=1915319 RepID=A0ABX3MVX6_9RHOB|nr:bifunctional DNA primase/polymerase [Thioclava sediminum]OOY23439.1 hypothetical protein BMI91_13175 [Thioclava sediminum]
MKNDHAEAPDAHEKDGLSEEALKAALKKASLSEAERAKRDEETSAKVIRFDDWINEHGADVRPRSHVADHLRDMPHDPLPVPKGVIFGRPPRASLYHTERAEGARQRAAEELGDELTEAQHLLFEAGVRRVSEHFADTADHNAMTLAYALRYARAGLFVADSYAIDPRTGAGMSMSGEAKVPLGAGWQKRASMDRAEIVDFWTGSGTYPANRDGIEWNYKRPRYPRNVSIVLPYGCGLFVLDEDGEEGMAAIAALEAEHGPLPKTLDSRSGSGNGRHRIFRASRPIRNTASQVAHKVDIRGEGGQIIAAPSIHKSGNFYQWADGCAPWECEIADAPAWLENLAHDAMKTNATKVKSERQKARREAREGGKSTTSGGLGFEGHLARIGDGDDRDGFDAPIYRAALSWWGVNEDGDEAELFDTLREVILLAPCNDDRAEHRYAADDYLTNRIAQARTYIEENRAAEAEADREEADALDAARAALRDNLTEEEGKTALAANAAQVALSRLVEMGISQEDAADYVEEAKKDVLRQLETRAEDRDTDPVKEAKEEAAGTPSPAILSPLYDERLVDSEGFMVRAEAAPGLYRAFGIQPKADNAEVRMRLEIRDQMFAALNARVSWVVLDGEAKWALHAEAGEAVRMWKEATINKLFVNRAVSYWEGEGDKAKVKMIKPADVITYARQRATYLDTCFEPDPAKAKAAVARGAFNLWTGFAVDPAPGDWSRLRGHILDQICGGDVDLFNWVLTWLASLFARPGVKIPSAIAVQGEQGTGKSKVFDWVRRAIGAAAIKISNGKHLTGNFNAHMDGKIFMTCEESFWGGAKGDAGIIKDLISSETLQIEGKFANLVERPNYINMAFVSNDKWMIPTDDEDARRFLVLTCLPTRKQDAAFFGAIDDQMENGGLEAMVHELMHWQPEAVGLTWDSLRNPPVTEGLRQQVGMGLRGPMARLAAILESGELTGRERGGSEFYYELSDDSETVVARSHLMLALYPDTERGNMDTEAKDAIAKLLGEDADGGSNKRTVHYWGGFRRDDRDKGEDLDLIELREPLQKRDRFVTIPPLSTARTTLATFGRG